MSCRTRHFDSEARHMPAAGRVRRCAPSSWSISYTNKLDTVCADIKNRYGEMPTAAVGIGDSDFHVGLLWRPGVSPVPGTFRQIGRADGGMWLAAASAAFD